MLTRNSFIKGTLAAIAMPTLIPAKVLGRNGDVPPSEKITLGGIGIGCRGRYVLGHMLKQKDVQCVAVNNVNRDHLKLAEDLVNKYYGNKDVKTYLDLRDLIARKDIDTVLIATGDRWHTPASIMAAKAGKDVYCEKPCGMSIQEVNDLADTMNRYGRVFQAGTQRRNVSNFQFARYLAVSGKLGRLHTVHAAIYYLHSNYGWLPEEPLPPKDYCDWDLWLGPAPWRPFNHNYLNMWGWYGYEDLNCAATLHDWGAHTVDLCQWAVGADGTTPLTYEVQPDGNTIVAEYANKVKLVMRTMSGYLGTCPIRFEGDEGWVETGDTGRVEVYPKSLQKERSRFARALLGTDPAGHVRNFFDCVKSRANPTCGPERMRYSHHTCFAGYTSWKLRRKVTFDPKTFRFVGDDEANAMISRPRRAPWGV